jgi:predicted acylesterase/phospholipase RssA/CRP-like cAMP-binding protein
VAGGDGDVRDLAQLLRSVPLFATLSPDDCLDVAGLASVVRVGANCLLFRQGDPADAMYVVLSGRLEALVAVGAGERAVRAFNRGELIGELGLLAENERSASIRAVRVSELLRIDGDVFARLLEHSPGFARGLSRSLARRLQQSGPSLVEAGPSPRVLAAVFLDPGTPEMLLRETLAATLRKWGSVSVIRSARAKSPVELAQLLRSEEERVDRVLLVAGGLSADQEWTSFCIHQADAIIAVARLGAPPPGRDVATALGGCHLILIGEGAKGAEVRSWLDLLRPSGHTLAGAATVDPEAMESAVRRTVGKSLGLVLSGGGARGLAHIGVLEVLAERGLEIDRFGGCSMGAFVGALAASGATAEEVHDVCRDELVRRKPFADYTVPRVALIRAARAEAMLRRVFGQLAIEELRHDFFCVSADLLTAEVVVHRRGTVVRAVGASMSLPGLAPPVVDGDRLLVDGGVLDNLPIDVMAATGEGPIVAVDVMRRISEEHRASGGARTQLPSIVETLSRATALGSWHLAGRSQAQAALVITPDLPSVGTFEWRRFDQIVDAGRVAARRALEGWQADSQ